MNATVLGSSLALSLMLAAATPALAEPPPKLSNSSFSELDARVKLADGRPNEEMQLRGLKSYQQGQYRNAADAFATAAYYADKFSQHYLSLMHWHGVGMDPDPVQAYIWADLAAERGSVPLLAIREKMWAQLTPDQQAQAKSRGEEAYARYGDKVAKPRTDNKIRLLARSMTGSRVGFRHKLDINSPPIHGEWGGGAAMAGAAGAFSGGTTGEAFYSDERTDVAQYWRAQDRALSGGRVEVGEVGPVKTDPDRNPL